MITHLHLPKQVPRTTSTYFRFHSNRRGLKKKKKTTSNKIRHLRGINKICAGVGDWKVFIATCLEDLHNSLVLPAFAAFAREAITPKL